MSKKFNLWFVIGALVVGLVLGLIVRPAGQVLGGLVHYSQEIFLNGLKAGRSETLVINSSGEWAGTVNTTANATLAGTNTLSGATTISGTLSSTATSTLSGPNVLSGANTLSGTTTVSGILTASAAVTASGGVTLGGDVKVNTATSTLIIGQASGSGYYAGCLVLGDSGGTTSTPVYITATGATVTATTTKPASCR